MFLFQPLSFIFWSNMNISGDTDKRKNKIVIIFCRLAHWTGRIDLIFTQPSLLNKICLGCGTFKDLAPKSKSSCNIRQ